MRLRFSPRATRDLASIGDYLSERNPAAARRVRASIVGTLQILTQFPEAGRQQKVEGVRKIVVRPYPYVIYYSVSGSSGEIYIIAIQHAAQERDYEDR